MLAQTKDAGITEHAELRQFDKFAVLDLYLDLDIVRSANGHRPSTVTGNEFVAATSVAIGMIASTLSFTKSTLSESQVECVSVHNVYLDAR